MEAPTTTLADSLLEDLDDLSDVEEQQHQEDIGDNQAEQLEGGIQNDAAHSTLPFPSGDDEDIEDEATRQRKAFESLKGHDEVREMNGGSVATKMKLKRKRLLDDKDLNAHLSAVRAAICKNGHVFSNSSSAASSSSSSSIQQNGDKRKKLEEEEHRLIIASNRHLSNLSNELIRAHSELINAYKPKFPELAELVMDPVQYKNAIRIIWNEMDMTKVNDRLNEILNSNQIITISVAGSTTSGRPLTEEELKEVDEAASYMDKVLDVQKELTEFVESRMENLAPSVCALVGASTAARLLGLAGGLAELSKIPACNLQVLGQVRQSAASRAGMSSVHAKPHMGILAECDLVKRCPSYNQKKALKVVASKLALAARCDYVNVESGRPRSAESGKKFRAEIEAKFNKWEEPDKAPVVKALPKRIASSQTARLQS